MRQRAKNKNNWKSTVSVALVFISACGVTAVLFFAPIFNITQIYVVGNSRLISEYIIETSRAVVGNNIFRTSIAEVKARVSAIPYVDDSNAKREFPNRIKIWVRECVPSAVITYEDKFVIIDGNGKILEVRDDLGEHKIPAIHGFEVGSIKTGSIIDVKNKINFETAVECLKQIVHNNLLEDIISIDVSNLNSIDLNMQNRIVVKFGDNTQIAYKFNFMKSILSEYISPYEQGILEYNGERFTFRQTS